MYKSQIIRYLNPIARLGIPKYSIVFPLLVTILIPILSELYAYEIANNPAAVGTYIIFINVAAILYFSFRDGIRGGVIASTGSIAYYIYIIFTRNYVGDQFIGALEATAVLGVLYFLLATIIGWLKQTIDGLIVKETEARFSAEEGQVRLQTILQQLPVGVLIADMNGHIIGNKQIEKTIGSKVNPKLQPDENYVSQLAFRSNKPLLAKEWPLVRALKKGEVISGEEIEFRKSKNKRLYLRVNASPILNKHKKIIAAVSTIDDITQEKELEQRKDDFVNMASHELKTPITSMKLYIESLLKRIQNSKDERAIKTLVSIKNQTERLQELVNDLLDVSRIQTGKLNFTKEKFRLDILIEETIDILQGTTRNQPLLYKSKTPILVTADKFRIYQVLTNLITNASKYSPENTDIIVRAKKDGTKVVVSVQDYGIGITKDQQKKVFERLYQVTDVREKTFPGLGMGLYISKEIIRRHRGSIWVEGEKDKGSIFYFSLSLAK